jgi:integrase
MGRGGTPPQASSQAGQGTYSTNHARSDCTIRSGADAFASFHGACVSVFPQESRFTKVGRHARPRSATASRRAVVARSGSSPQVKNPRAQPHARGIDFAMWAGILEMGRNPISLVVNKGASRRVRKARSLTVEQFHALLTELREPFATLALLCVCLGLRISEALALKWEDVDWLQSRVSIRRGIVNQRVDDCKTEGSAKTFLLADDLLARLKAWKQASTFRDAGDWIFASPFKIGRLPISYTGTRVELARASVAAGLGHVSTHAFRHTYALGWTR